jgi:hypothetical protein
MSGGYFDVDTSVLRSIAGNLETAGADATSAGEGLSASPDAGQSSHEVAASIQALSDAVTGLGARVSSTGSDLRSTAADYDASDMSATDNLTGQGGYGGAGTPPAYSSPSTGGYGTPGLAR